MCVALFLCTAMIYACLKFLQEWATPLTVANFFLLGSASGFTLAATLPPRSRRELARFYALWAIALTLLAAAFRIASLARNRGCGRARRLQSAIGIAEPRIRQVSQGFTARLVQHARVFPRRRAPLRCAGCAGGSWLLCVRAAGACFSA